MRGSTSKVLKDISRAKYREMVAAGEINPPESPEHARQQWRKLHRVLKKTYVGLSRDVREKYVAPYRKLRIDRLSSKQS